MNQTIHHKWRPIEDLPQNHGELKSSELENLAEVWREQRQSLDETDRRRFLERLKREWAIETGILEQLYTLDRGITATLIEQGIDASLIPHDATNRPPELLAAILQDQEDAIDWVFDLIGGEQALSQSFIKALHQLITRHQETTVARDNLGRIVEVPLLRGEYKKLSNNPVRHDGSVHEYCPPEHVDAEMDRLLELHAEHMAKEVAPEVEAAWFHHRFTQIHPFQDGNGRVVRALTSFILIKAGWFPLVITRDDRSKYIEALEAADKTSLAPLANLFASIERRAFVAALGLASAVRREAERLDQVIAAARDTLRLQQRDLRQDWERVKEMASQLQDRADSRLADVVSQLDDEIAGEAPGFSFFNDNAASGTDRAMWFRYQVVETKPADYFANFTTYNTWSRLVLKNGTSQAEIVLSFHGIGREFRGLIAASLFFFRREEVESGERQVVDLTSAADELFQLNYLEDSSKAEERFSEWLERGLVRALELWRRGL